MERFAAMRSFRAVLDHQGFAAAAKALGVSKTTISKQVTALSVVRQIDALNRRPIDRSAKTHRRDTAGTQVTA
jgi:DNA-binding transcriptional LysR family regulator